MEEWDAEAGKEDRPQAGRQWDFLLEDQADFRHRQGLVAVHRLEQDDFRVVALSNVRHRHLNRAQVEPVVM